MTEMKLNFYVKEPKAHVKYKVTNEQLNISKAKQDFLMQTIIEEVRNAPIHKQKRFIKVLKQFSLASVSFLGLTMQTMASTNMDLKLPTEIWDIIMQLVGLTVVSGVGIACIFMVVAGIYRMMRKEKEAKSWTTDILKGLAQVLIATPVVMLICYLTTLLFANSQWFISPFVNH